MAVVTARNIDALDALTRQIQTNPADGCRVDRRASCVWIPDGIAVRAEALKTVDGVEKWVDALVRSHLPTRKPSRLDH